LTLPAESSSLEADAWTWTTIDAAAALPLAAAAPLAALVIVLAGQAARAARFECAWGADGVLVASIVMVCLLLFVQVKRLIKKIIRVN
jgi:hypothetical protein